MDENGGGKKEGGKRGRAGSRNGLFHSPTVEGGKNGGREGKQGRRGLEGEAPLSGGGGGGGGVYYYEKLFVVPS